MVSVLLDTDPGSDIDDVLAIAYLLKQPRCEFVGITTVSGDTPKRAALAEMVCRAFGREDIPIVAGAQLPLAHGQGQPNVPHYAAVAHVPHREYAPNRAVDYLRETIRSRPGEITLVTIGPVTNIALLFALDPEIPSLLKGMVSMFGSFFAPGRNEWNVKCDPTASRTVLDRSGPADFYGLDVTLQCTMPADIVRKRFDVEPQRVILPMAEKWFEHSGEITFHDPLAVASLFNPGLCTFETGEISAPMAEEGTGNDGRTLFTPTPTGRHRVATTVDRDAFFAEYFGVLES